MKNFTITALAALSVLLFSSIAIAEPPNPYKGFKVPPLEVSSDARYSHDYVLVFVAKHHAASGRTGTLDRPGQHRVR